MKYVVNDVKYKESQFVLIFEQLANVPLFLKWCEKKRIGERRSNETIFTGSEMIRFLRAIGYRAYIEFGFSKHLTRLLKKVIIL